MRSEDAQGAAAEYLAHGWRLVPIPVGSKGPTVAGWNRVERCVSGPEAAEALAFCNLGLAHAYSGTCAVDVDDYERAVEALSARGIDLDALLSDGRAVQIRSGRPNRAKLLYRLPPGAGCLGSVKLFGGAIELRCGTREGLTVQDVLPPSIHPDTGQPYQWGGMGRWSQLPELPGAIVVLWYEQLAHYAGQARPAAHVGGFATIPLDGIGLPSATRELIERGDVRGRYPSRSEALFRVLADLVRAGLEDAAICRVVCDPAHAISAKPLEERRGDLESAMQWVARQIPKARDAVAARKTTGGAAGDGPPPPVEGPPPEPGGPDAKPGSIRIFGGSLPANVDAAERALIRSQGNLFIHGNRLVRVAKWDLGAPGVVKRWAGASVLCEVSANWLADVLTRCASWERFDKRSDDWRVVDAPKRVAETLLAREGEWRFRRLAGFLEAPIVEPGGRVIDRPGYDAETGLYIAGDLRIKPIGQPSRADARNAVHALTDLVGTFQPSFLDPRDLSATLAAMLTAIQRRVLPTAPFFGISASTPATGKSLLADCIAALATGRVASAMALGQDGPELEKRIDAALLDADPLILIDNVDRAVRSDVLCQVATQTHKTVRVLGYTRKVESPTNICWVLTGNNLTLLGDLTRRVCMIHLDAKCERPERRKFERDALSHILRHRAEGVRAALVVVKAYLDANCPDVGIPPIGSFELWDRMVRRALVWAGLPDPLDMERDLREEDHEYVAIRDLLQQWLAVAGNEPITAAQLMHLAKQGSSEFSGRWVPDNPGLHDAITSLLGDGARMNAQALGYKLRAWQNRIIDGLRITRVRLSGRSGVLWLASKV